MDSVRFCQLAPLLGAYPGAVAARHRSAAPVEPAGVVSEPSPVRPVPDRPRYAAPAPPPGAQVVESSRTALSMSPLSDMFSFATVGG
jgi:hypothetical protein